MNRGSSARSRLAAIRSVASMRPRFMNRGSARPVCDRCDSSSRFNEAPIHESGKCPPDGRLPRAWIPLQ